MTIFELIAQVLFDESTLSEQSCRSLAGSILNALKLKGYTVTGPENTHHADSDETNHIP